MFLKTGSNGWRDSGYFIWLFESKKIKKHLNYYKYGYNKNQWNSEISKIKKMAAFWNLDIDFPSAFRLSVGKRK